MREGRAPLAVRRRAAQGELALPASACIEALVLLTVDPDVEVRTLALRTLEHWDPHELSEVLADPATPRRVLDFVAESPVLSRDDLLDAVYRNPALAGYPDESSSPSHAAPALPAAVEVPAAARADAGSNSASQRIARMTVSERIHAALTGGTDERMLLIRDANKAVARAALMSPKVTERELEAFASMTNIAEEVLRALAARRAFTRHYAVVRSLANNPRMPIDGALPLLARLNERDLRTLAVNHNVGDPVRHAAAQLAQARQRS